jgi:hypothetical protein
MGFQKSLGLSFIISSMFVVTRLNSGGYRPYPELQKNWWPLVNPDLKVRCAGWASRSLTVLLCPPAHRPSLQDGA